MTLRLIHPTFKASALLLVLSSFTVSGAALQPAPPGEPPPGDRPPMAGPRGLPGERLRNGSARPEMRRRWMERRGENQTDDGPPSIPREMIDWSLEAMKTKLPRLHDRLTSLRQNNPQRFEQVFRKLLPIFREYRELKERRPDIAEKVLEEFQAEDQLRELSNEYLTSKDNPTKQASLSKEMEQLVRKQFELRQQRFEARLQEFEDRIKDQQLQHQTMHDRLQSMSTRRDDFVNRRVEQIKAGRMGEPVPGMEPPFGPPGRGPGGPGRPGRDNFAAPGMDRPPPPHGESPPDDDRGPPQPDGPGGPPPAEPPTD